jgi:hypothetical protein
MTHLSDWSSSEMLFRICVDVDTALLRRRPALAFIIYDWSFECPRGVTHSLPSASISPTHAAAPVVGQSRALVAFTEVASFSPLRRPRVHRAVRDRYDASLSSARPAGRPMLPNPAQPRCDAPSDWFPFLSLQRVRRRYVCYKPVISSIFFHFVGGHVFSRFGNLEAMLLCLPPACLLGRDAVWTCR